MNEFLLTYNTSVRGAGNARNCHRFGEGGGGGGEGGGQPVLEEATMSVTWK